MSIRTEKERGKFRDFHGEGQKTEFIFLKYYIKSKQININKYTNIFPRIITIFLLGGIKKRRRLRSGTSCTNCNGPNIVKLKIEAKKYSMPNTNKIPTQIGWYTYLTGV